MDFDKVFQFLSLSLPRRKDVHPFPRADVPGPMLQLNME